jgi:hypothetical protein
MTALTNEELAEIEITTFISESVSVEIIQGDAT